MQNYTAVDCIVSVPHSRRLYCLEKEAQVLPRCTKKEKKRKIVKKNNNCVIFFIIQFSKTQQTKSKQTKKVIKIQKAYYHIFLFKLQLKKNELKKEEMHFFSFF